MQIQLVEMYCEQGGPEGGGITNHFKAASNTMEEDDEARLELNPNSEPDVHGGRRIRIRDRYGATAPVLCWCGAFARRRNISTLVIDLETRESSTLLDALFKRFPRAEKLYADMPGSPP